MLHNIKAVKNVRLWHAQFGFFITHHHIQCFVLCILHCMIVFHTACVAGGEKDLEDLLIAYMFLMPLFDKRGLLQLLLTKVL